MNLRRATFVLNLFVVVSIIGLFTGCGGGGGGGGGSSSSTSISGVASECLILDGTVKVYPLNVDGTKGAQLGSTTQTSSIDGTYSVSLGSYTGNVIVEVTGGTYKDEASGTVVSNNEVRAALTNVSGKATLAVTSLTELAVQLATTLSTDSINKNNSLVSSMVGVDIIGTLPVDVTNQTASNAANRDQITYGLMLATISQMSKNQGKAHDDVITELKNDLADNGQLSTTGADVVSALAGFIANANNKSGVTSLTKTPLATAIDYITNNQITPPTDTSDLNKAKNAVTDIRNTILTIYNYQGVGAVGIVQTPFNNLASEVETELKPELTGTINYIGEVINAIPHLTLVSGGAPAEIGWADGDVLDASLAADNKTVTFTLNNSTGTVGSGTVVVDNMNQPTSGSLSATFQTASSATLTVTAAFTATVDSTTKTYSSMTFTGNIKVPNAFELDFSQSGRKLYATFAPNPVDSTKIYPTDVSFSGLVQTQTTQLTGTIDVPNIIYSTAMSSPVPESATITGVFEALNSDGSLSGTTFTGSINGNWTNASTYNSTIPKSSTNYPQWNATFSGKIEAPSSPTTTASLKVTQNAYDTYTFDVNFTRTNTDNSVIFISGSGEYDSTTQITTADLSNQDNMKINFTYDQTKSKDESLTGTITTSGGVIQANLNNLDGIPSVKFIDNYFETLI